MNILRKIVSFVVLVVAIIVLVGTCMSSLMEPVWLMFKVAFDPFDFMNMVNAIAAFFDKLGTPIILLMLGFIGVTIPGKRK